MQIIKADLPAVIKICNHLNQIEIDIFTSGIQYFENLFDNTLGDWKNKPVTSC